jgi:hypothetical protein
MLEISIDLVQNYEIRNWVGSTVQGEQIYTQYAKSRGKRVILMAPEIFRVPY